jgi:hypothetical protein
MRRVILKRVALALVASWMLASPLLQAAPELRSQRNEHFEVVGLHLRSVSHINELSLVAIEIAGRYLDPEGMAFPMPILISLRPEAYADFEGDYRIQLAGRASVRLDLRWGDTMTLERSCHAIAEALLVQYAVYNFGLEGAKNLRSWPVSALGEELYFSLRSAELVDLVDRTRESDLPPLTAVVQSMQAEPTVASASGYWLLQAMKVGSLKRPLLRSLFRQAIAGGDVEEALTAAVQPSDPTSEVLPGQVWWQGQMEVLLRREYDVIEPMDASRAWLASLTRLDTPLALESGEIQLNLRSIWTHRAEPQLREMIQARYAILRLRMARTNPAYYNAARSLGVLFERILDDAPSHQYLHALTIYLSDWEDAKEMQDEIENILDKK